MTLKAATTRAGSFTGQGRNANAWKTVNRLVFSPIPIASVSTATSANPGCLLQVSAALRRAGRPLPALHPIELLDASIRGVALRLRA